MSHFIGAFIPRNRPHSSQTRARSPSLAHQLTRIVLSKPLKQPKIIKFRRNVGRLSLLCRLCFESPPRLCERTKYSWKRNDLCLFVRDVCCARWIYAGGDISMNLYSKDQELISDKIFDEIFSCFKIVVWYEFAQVRCWFMLTTADDVLKVSNNIWWKDSTETVNIFDNFPGKKWFESSKESFWKLETSRNPNKFPGNQVKQHKSCFNQTPIFNPSYTDA